MTFSEKLTELRKNTGETQDALGDTLGVSGKTISKWESNATEPDLTMLVAIADHYQVSIDTLFDRGEPENVIAHMKKELRSTKDAGEAMQKFWQYSRGLIGAVGNAPLNTVTDPDDCIPNDSTYNNRQYRSNYESNNGTFVNYHTEAVRMGMQLFRSPSDFAWIQSDRDALADLFALFSDPDVLSLLYTLHRVDFSEDFTSAYLAEQSGVAVEKTEAMLEKLLTFTGLSKEGYKLNRSTVETLDGERVIYSFLGDENLLGMLALAKILLSGWNGCNCMSWQGSCKMIGKATVSDETKGE